MKKILTILAAALAAVLTISCEKDLYLPPDWNYDIPDTPVTADIHLGALYHNYTDVTWKSEHYTPVLNQVVEDGTVTDEIPYTSTQVGVLTQQCEWAARAGIENFRGCGRELQFFPSWPDGTWRFRCRFRFGGS